MKKNNGKISISIEDDGTGFESELDYSQGLGINIMKYRANIIGGTLDFEKIKPNGTIVSCVLNDNTQSTEMRS